MGWTRLWMAAWVGMVLSGSATGADTWHLVKDGKPQGAIVIPDEPGQVYTQWAPWSGKVEPYEVSAKFLQTYLRKVTGATVPIVKESDAPARNLVLVGLGKLARSKGISVDGLKPEGFRVKTFPGGVALVGETQADPDIQIFTSKKQPRYPRLDRGTMYAVLEFLERAAGVRWYFGGDLWSVVPATRDLAVGPMDIEKAPAFQMRWGGRGAGAADEWFPCYRWGSTSLLFVNHTFYTWGPYFGKKHPEYFAIRTDGTRHINYKSYYRPVSHNCFSEPGVIKQFIENVKRWDEKGDNRNMFGIIPPNGPYVYTCAADVWELRGMCHCWRCLSAWRPHQPPGPMGKLSDLWVDFNIRLARELKKHWPKRRVAMLVYSEYERVPKAIRQLPDNVDVCVALVTGPTIQVDPRVRAVQQANIDAWSRMLGGDRRRLTSWFYFMYPQSFVASPMLAPHEFSRWAKTNVHKMSGVFSDAPGPQRNPAGWVKLTMLMVWLKHKLLWDPQADVDALIDRFCRDMFGPAYRPMKALFDLETERWENTRWSMIDGRSFVPDRIVHQEVYPPAVTAKLRALLKQAQSLAAPGTPDRKRVDWYAEAHREFFENNRLFNHWYMRPYLVTAKRTDPTRADWCRNLNAYPLNDWRYGAKPSARTTVSLGHDEKSLVVHAELFDATPAKLVARGKQDQDPAIAGDDNLQVRIDQDDRAYYHYVRVNPKGVVRTGIQAVEKLLRGLDPTNLRAEWPAEGIRATTRVKTDRWTVDLTIPFSTLAKWGFGKDVYARGMRMQIVRFKRTKPGGKMTLYPELGQPWETSMDRFAVARFVR